MPRVSGWIDSLDEPEICAYWTEEPMSGVDAAD